MSEEERLDRRTFLKYGGAAATTVAIAGCQSGDGGDGEDGDSGDGEEMPDFPVWITQGNMPSGLDPHDHRETPTDVVMLHAYEGVLTRNADGEVQTNLATEYERVEEGHVRFTIREDVQFHNGDDLTPGDVAYTINRIVQRMSASPARNATSSQASRRRPWRTTAAWLRSSRTASIPSCSRSSRPTVT
jgi:peptide/nickel transport system substrate-binding protein